jgi:hypothetical protein
MGTDVPGGYNESVPLMIPSNFGTTFAYVGQDIMDNASRLCFSCHDSTEVFDNIPDDGLDTNFKSALPDPPLNYSYSTGDTNQHIQHTVGATMQCWDSDWDEATTGPGPGPGYDSLMICSSCHNVHGAAGADGSTNEPMIRDGSLAGRTGYGFSYLISGGYPTVTSIGASLPISVGAVLRNGNAMCSVNCHNPTPPGPLTTAYDATGSGTGSYLEYYRAVGTFSCSDCHAYETEASHPTHADSSGKGVDLGCFDCHDSDGHVNDTVDFPGGPLSATTACDACHSTGGAYGGVDMAKGNWVAGIYEPDGVTLQPGKDQWCAGCHDDVGANSKQDGTGITAPNIMGDSGQEIYGYIVSGHGRPSANLTCDVCHDLTRTHIDHDPRTYDVNESSSSGNDISTYSGHSYKKGYRLKAGLEMPRNSWDDDYYLCTNCHQEVMGTKTNFRYPSGGGDNLHGTHIRQFGSFDWGWDSDADGVPCTPGTGDSWMSCTGCHNVHGSPMDVNYDDVLTPNPVMVRHGELMNAEPGLDFRWFTGNYATGASTDKRNDSLSAIVTVVEPFCSFDGCHGGARIYDRTPYIFLPGFLVDDFESYGDDASLRVNWKRENDAKLAYFEVDAGPDGSKCMRVRTDWAKTVEDHGIMKRKYDPYVQIGYMESMSFQVMVVNTDKIYQIGVMLQVYPEETYHEYIVDTAAELQNNVWKEITIPISSFGIDPFDKLSEVRFRTYEASPTELWAQNVYLDDIRFTPPSYTVSGSVSGGSVGPLDGVIMRGFPGDNVVTSGGGVYSGTVYDIGPGWTGTITPEKPGYSFVPAEIPYTDVTSDLAGQDYTPSLDTSAIISESFEGIGYEEEDWSESIGTNCVLDEDSIIPGTPPVDFGSECLQSVSDDTGYKARADLDYGYTFEQPRTFTTFYCLVEAESLASGEHKNIGVFLNNGMDSVAVLRLFKSTEGDLKFRMRPYNNGGFTDFDSGAISLNEWYKIQFMYDDTENTWEWRLDGVLQDGEDLTGTHRTGIREWRLGFWQSSQAITGTMYFDNFSVGVGTYIAD